MGWNISHGGTKHGFSYTSVGNLRDLLKERASWSQRRTLRSVLDRRSGDPFSVSPRDAKAVGETLTTLAAGLPSTWAAMARQIGESAVRAAQANEPWRWS